MNILVQASARQVAQTRTVGRYPGKKARALGVVASAAVLISVLSGGSALAASEDSVPGSIPATVSDPAAYPPAGVTDQGGPLLCPSQPQIVDAGPYGGYNPRVATAADGTPIAEDVGYVGTENAGCGDSVTFYLETKVCGFFGCNWTVVDQETYNQLPAYGTLVSRMLTAPLRSGTNRYRVRTEITTYKVEAEDGAGPGIVAVVPEVEEITPVGAQLTHP